jgi:alkylation response protein AidB-like acyl-CoA dehydrogenase
VEERIRELLRARDPATTDTVDFLGAQFDAGLALVTLPAGLGGLGADRATQAVVDAALSEAGAPRAFWRNPLGIGMGLPTLAAHGSPAQQARYFRPCFTGEEVWCQLFSEPGAGSDLAGLSTRAERDGDEWIVNGQKVWTSLAHQAHVGLLLARTDPHAPKHKGLTFFLVDMHAPGVEVRPLREMTGDANFNEVFLTDVRVPDSLRVGDLGRGWTVAGTMLASERSLLSGAGGAGTVGGSRIEKVLSGAPRGWAQDRALCDDMMRRWSESQVIRWTNRRNRATGRAAEASVMKLFQGLHNQRLQATALRLEPNALAWEPGDADAAAAIHGFLRAQANTIEGGASNVLRNLIGEKLLGLPREPGPASDTPWSDLLRNG